MRNLIFISVLSLLVFISVGYAEAQGGSDSIETLAQLQSYQSSSFSPKVHASGNISERMSEVIDIFKKIAKNKELQTNEVLLREALRVALLTREADPTLYLFEILLPVYQKNLGLVERAIGSLPAPDQKEILKIFRQIARMLRDGNG